MKRKEILALAKKIAQQEMILENSTDSAEKARAEKEIIKLSASVKSLSDMVELDDAIQDFLRHKS